LGFAERGLFFCLSGLTQHLDSAILCRVACLKAFAESGEEIRAARSQHADANIGEALRCSGVCFRHDPLTQRV
jgi:hypothetical protein